MKLKNLYNLAFNKHAAPFSQETNTPDDIDSDIDDGSAADSYSQGNTKNRYLSQLAVGLPTIAVLNKLRNYYEKNPSQLSENIRVRNTMNAAQPFLDEIDPKVFNAAGGREAFANSPLHKLKKSIAGMAMATEAQKYLAIPAIAAAYHKVSKDPDSDLSKAAPYLAALATPGSLAAPTAITSGIKTIRKVIKEKALGDAAWKDVNILKDVVPKAMIPGLLSVALPALAGGLVEWNRRKASENRNKNKKDDKINKNHQFNKDYSELLKKLKTRRGEL